MDDDVCFLDVSKQILAMQNNFDIDNAMSVDEAFKKMEQQNYDAIVSDFEMPQKNGLDFLKELRDQNNQIPFILFTGKGREDVAIKALNLGADRYINKQGNPETVYGELSDALIKTIEHKQSKKMLVESESKYRKLVENSLQGIAIIQGPPPKFVFANAAMKKLFGYTPEEMIALSSEQIIRSVHPDDRDVFFDRFKKRIEGKEPELPYVFRGFRKDGTLRWVEVCANLIEFNGKPAVQAVFLDITENKRAEENLRESEQKYRELANCLPDIVFETNLNGQLEFANERAAQISGYCIKDIEKGLNILQFVVPEDREKAAKKIHRLLSGSGYAPAEYTFLRKDGTTFPALVTATPRICKSKITGLRGIAIDISERKKLELAQKEKYAVLERVGESIGAGLAIIGKDYSIFWANSLLKKTIVNRNKKCYQNFSKSNAVCPDCGAKKIFEQNVSFDAHEYETINSKGEKGWIELRVTPLKDKNGDTIAALELAVPITERKKTEERRKVLEGKVNEYSKHLKYIVELRTAQLKDANERLIKTERLAAIGELAGMVGHDLRNPLTGIKNAAYYLKKKGTSISETQFKEMLEIIDKSIDHSNKIINDLLDYAREMHLELTEYSAHSIVDDATRMIVIPDRIQIINDVNDEVSILVDADKMMRVFTNLIKNAIDAMPESGTLKITSCQTKQRIKIAFTDTGTGIPKETLPKIFSPLFTTKAQGMGFGLAICKRIIDAHQGNITVETYENKGTMFTITLPVKPKVALLENQNAN